MSESTAAVRWRFRQASQAAGAGFWEWDVHSGELVCDEATLTVLGIAEKIFDGRIETWMAAVHPEDLPWVLAERHNAIRNRGVFSAEYRVCHTDGTVGWAQECGSPALREDGEPARLMGLVWDTTDTRVARESVDRALRYMSDGFLMIDADWRITFANAEAERLIDAPRELFGRLLWDVFSGVTHDLESRYRKAAAEGVPVDLDVQWPTTQRWYHMRVAPVLNGLTVYITDFTERQMREAEREAAEKVAAERTAKIGQLTAALAEALTVRDVVDAVAKHVLPPFGASGLVVNLVTGDHMQIAGCVNYSEEFIEDVGRMPVTGKFPIPDVIRNRAPRFISTADEFIGLYPHLAHIPVAGDKKAWAFLPLIASGHAMGGLAISFSHPRRFTGEERSLLTAISGLVAQALERARLYDAEHARAQELQRGMLPRILPSLPAVTAAARYLPASKDMEVGGDWYDVIPLSADRVALVIGDVMGHGVSEAATMGRLRTAVHTLADLELPPDELLTHLNGIVSDLGDDFYATCLYMVYDPTDHTCVFARAGHPPPAIIHPDGTVHFPAGDPDPPLGAATPPFGTTELELPENSFLVLYTDGLVESATLDMDQGMTDLARALKIGLAQEPCRREPDIARKGAVDEGLESLCDTVVTTLLPAQQATTDDAALLIARTHTLTADDIASWPLPYDPVAAGQAREHIRAQLAAWDLDALAMTTELLASELVGNVVRHAKGPIHLRLLRSQVLTCEVSDGSLTTPRVRRTTETDEGGRGLQLVAALSRRWGTRYTATGKCIWTEQPLPSP